MKKMVLAAAAIFLALPLAAQTQPNEQPSLGDAARKLREQKKPPAKPVKVITNDNLGSSSAAATPAAETAAAPAEAGPSQAKPSKPGAQAEETPEKKLAKEEAQWHKRFAEAHTKLEQAEKELDVLQRELNLLQQQYYSDPNKALQQQYSRQDIDAHRQKIADQQQEVDKLKQALSDLEDELRRSGGDPGWARP